MGIELADFTGMPNLASGGEIWFGVNPQLDPCSERIPLDILQFFPFPAFPGEFLQPPQISQIILGKVALRAPNLFDVCNPSYIGQILLGNLLIQAGRNIQRKRIKGAIARRPSRGHGAVQFHVSMETLIVKENP